MKTLSVRHAALSVLLLLLIAAVQIADEQTMVVTAAPTTASELNTPAAVSAVNGDETRQAAPRVNLPESLGAVSGLQMQSRRNYTQDPQLSVRGFSSRLTCGVCGLRVYVDGIPVTIPDGRGRTSNIDIGSVDTIEVLRGPFSVLYDNSSGGAINATSQTGTQPPTVEASSYHGSLGTWYHGVKATGAAGDGSYASDVDYTVLTNHFTAHGYCDHSGARKNLANARLGVRINDISKPTLLSSSMDIEANDAGGSTADKWCDNPRQSPRGDQYNTCKNTRRTQAGLRYECQLNAQDDLSVMMYVDERETAQSQSIPCAPQLKPSYAGGAIDLTRHYQGTNTRLTRRGELLVPVTLTAGLDYEDVSERRKGYENFAMVNSAPQYGEQGALCRSEHNLMWNVDPYLQAQWQLTDKLSLDAEVRYGSVWFDLNDYYTIPDNSDDSGDASYHKWLPAGSPKYALTDAWNVYLSVGHGFETPTINGLSYCSDSRSGLNFGLKPSTNDAVEIDSKTRLGNGLLTAALFQTNIDNEVVVDSNSSGRTSYRNADKTRRQGAELGLDQQFGGSRRLKVAQIWLDMTYRANVCGDASCDSNRISGIVCNMGYVSFGYQPEQGWYADSDTRYMSDIMANDKNTAKAPSWMVVGLTTGYKWSYGRTGMDSFGRVDNLFDREYVGSVIVNESNGRYYEPVPECNYGIGLNLVWCSE